VPAAMHRGRRHPQPTAADAAATVACGGGL
jgi:hypothetical protein